MAVKLVIAPEAEQDLAEAYAWHERQRTGLGEEFLGCCRSVCNANTAMLRQGLSRLDCVMPDNGMPS